MEPEDIVRGKDRSDQDRLDQWLDTALRELGNAEPRMGLESRILANVTAERERAGIRRRWWGFGSVGAVAAVAMVVWLGHENNRSKPVRNVAGNTTSATQRTREGNAESEVKRRVMEATAQRRTRPHNATAVDVAAAPRLSQFPSPRPLSEQEQLLLRYVTEAPSEALLIAKEQAEWRRELQDSAENPGETKSGDLNQEER